MEILRAADLFCGAGGTSAGLVEAAELLGRDIELTAVNHWEMAIATHSANHPGARHFCASLDSVIPRDLYPQGALELLWASPECTHHSIARGGRPVNDQQRATAWCVIRWAEALLPGVILVENVREFANWGPCTPRGRPIASRKGEIFQAWVQALRAIGYRVAWRLICCADYGDPTTRTRLFIQAVRGKRRLAWPSPTHSRDGEGSLFPLRPWRTAREIIDWSIEGRSIFTRKRPLKPATIRRIAQGMMRYGLAPWLVTTTHTHDQSFRGGSVDDPLKTVTTKAAEALAVPFLVQLRGTSTSASVKNPLGAVTAGGGHFGALNPFVIPQQAGGCLTKSVDKPVSTVTTISCERLAVPFLLQYNGTADSRMIDIPLGTVTTIDRFALVEIILVRCIESGVLPTVVIAGKRYHLDILFRMLQPHELAAAQGFSAAYRFQGNQSEVIRQIGNAVPRNTARALALAALTQCEDVSGYWTKEVTDAEGAA